MDTIVIYGIPNCDTVKKSLDWFRANKIPYLFHNYKTQGITILKLKEWNKLVGWETFFNKKSSTWKQHAALFETEQLTSAKAFKLMQENTSIIKRPVIQTNGTIVVGFNGNIYSKQFLKK